MGRGFLNNRNRVISYDPNVLPRPLVPMSKIHSNLESTYLECPTVVGFFQVLEVCRLRDQG